MELRILHFYPDLMSLYGSYANVAVLKRQLEAMGNVVAVEQIQPGSSAEVAGADFLFMGAGTERAQKFALADFIRYGEAVKAAAAAGTAMLFCGTAMELLGKSITAEDGTVSAGIALADFTSAQQKKRIVEDVYGLTDLYDAAVIGFMNKCSVISGVETPLLASMDLGFGNDAPNAPEGLHWNNVFASHLTGPLLVKNPGMLHAVVSAIYAHRGEPLPELLPRDRWAEDGYAISAEQLKQRCTNKPL